MCNLMWILFCHCNLMWILYDKHNLRRIFFHRWNLKGLWSFQEKKDLFRPPFSYLWLVAFLLLLSVIGWVFSGHLWLAELYQWVINESSCYHPQSYVFNHMLFSKGLCYRPQSYVISHRAMYVIIHRAMLSSTELCYHPKGYAIVQMLSSTELCYCPYVIVHRTMFLSKGLCYHLRWGWRSWQAMWRITSGWRDQMPLFSSSRTTCCSEAGVLIYKIARFKRFIIPQGWDSPNSTNFLYYPQKIVEC